MRLRSSKASSLTITVPPGSRRGSSLRSAAGFMATSTFGASPGRGDLVVGDVHLERRHPGERAGGRTDLGREVRQRREVVPEQRAGAGEAIAGELHAVAGVAGEADDDPIEALGCDITGRCVARALGGV